MSIVLWAGTEKYLHKHYWVLNLRGFPRQVCEILSLRSSLVLFSLLVLWTSADRKVLNKLKSTYHSLTKHTERKESLKCFNEHLDKQRTIVIDALSWVWAGVTLTPVVSLVDVSLQTQILFVAPGTCCPICHILFRVDVYRETPSITYCIRKLCHIRRYEILSLFSDKKSHSLAVLIKKEH